ncbi:MAG: monomethylamine:corrinoid methyltransferase, partial [Candidatus Methanomethylophilaceae archaeon]|nr:monomethylamine:corrinoid methyltransferase [Candidatus Methanomethylophilaceae archaeon]
PPAGKRFQDCYDIKDVVPSNEYLKVYEKALGTLRNCGLGL